MRRPFALFSLSFITVFASMADQANILNNGGFETGLMCYQDWIWSQTGQDFKGDYKFNLSSDAHLGTHSMEIACMGADCLKAAVYSNRIPTTPGQAYKINVYSKCPANTNNFIYVLDSANGQGAQTLTCNGNWAPNQLSFQSAPLAQFFVVYLFNADVSWLRVDDVVVTYADGTVPPHTVLHPGIRPVGISGQNVTVDGKPYLSLGYVNVGYNDLPAAAATGANTVNGLESYSNADCFNATQPGYLDRAYSLGLNFLPDSTTTARLLVPGVFPAAVQTFAPHLAVLGWSLADEPDLIELPFTYIPAATLTAEYNAVKSATSLPVTFDSQHAAYDSASCVAPADVWMAEPYGPDFYTVAHAASVFNSLQKRPIWLYQDAIDAALIVPKAYWAIIHGVTGIHYFDWDQFKADSGKLAATTQVFGELKSLNKAIFGTNLDTLATATAGIGYTARYDAAADSLYVLSVNPFLGGVSANVQASFTVKGLTAGQKVTVMFENRTIAAQAGGFTDAFTGVTRHVYQVANFMKGTPVAILSPSISNKSGADSNRDWKIKVSNTGTALAKAVQITGVTFAETGGTACTPALTGRALPLALGNIFNNASESGDIHVNFTGCDATSRFGVTVALSANSGALLQTVVIPNQQK
jgi:hypothetical protein